MKVRLKKQSRTRYTEFTFGNVYSVIGIEAGDYRIMNDYGQPYLYPPKLFEIVESTPGSKWRRSVGDQAEEYAYPPELAAPGFFEDYFNGDRRAQLVLERYLISSRKMTKRHRGKAA